MKHIFFSLAFLVTSYFSFSQTFWTETFGSGCTQGNTANSIATPSNGAWVSNTLTAAPANGFAANEWFISATEAGFAAGTCGDGCISTTSLTNRSLHVSVNFGAPLIDIGAAYLAGPFGYNTNKRAESPVINCTGQNNIVLSMLYMAGGVAGQDYFEVQYSANGGGAWTSIGTPTITNNASCGGQGLWTTYSVALPASANNNPNVKIGFRWQNMASAGTDPSAAVDNIELSSSTASSTFAPSFNVTSPLCSGNNQTVTANTGTFAVSGYTWSVLPSGATVASPNASATSITFNTANTYSITLTATSGATTASSTNTILVNATPTLSVNGPFTICTGQTATLTASGASSYTWNPGGFPLAGIVVFPSSTTVYTVNGSNGSCSSGMSTTVTVNTTPTVNASANPGVICLGSGNTSTLTATGASTYTWNPGNLTGSVVVVSPSSFTNYTVTGSNGSCNASTLVPVFVSNSPTINAIANPTMPCVAQTVTLSATGAFSYTWSPGGATSSSITVASPSVAGMVTYTVAGSNGTCTSIGTATFFVSACISGLHPENLQKDNYAVYPNPAHDKLFIEASQSTTFNVEVIDALGKMILRENHSNETKVSVNINHLPKGIYFLKVSSDGGAKLTRFVKE